MTRNEFLGRCLTVLAICGAGLCPAGCKGKGARQPATTRGTATASALGPRCVLSREFIDVGHMEPKTERDEKVLIRNTGGRELLIRKCMIACRCFKAVLDRMQVPPGGSAEMTVKILSLDYQGENKENIGLATNDPAGPVVLTVRFVVSQALTVQPERLYLGVVKPAQVVKRQVKVVANGDVQTKLLYAISNNPSLIGRVVDAPLTASKPAVLEAEFKAPDQPGTYRNDLTITTAHSSQPTVSLPVVLCVAKSVTVRPEEMDFGRCVRGGPMQRALTLTLAKGAALEIPRTRPEKVLDISVSEPDAQGAVRLLARVRRDAPYGPMRGEVLLKVTDAQSAAALAVPFHGYVAADDQAPQP